MILTKKHFLILRNFVPEILSGVVSTFLGKEYHRVNHLTYTTRPKDGIASSAFAESIVNIATPQTEMEIYSNAQV